MIRIMRFFPALIFLIFWLIVVDRGVDLKRTAQLPIVSDRFITTIAQGIDNPWTHVSALRIFFLRLLQEEAPARIWAGSQAFGWALWHQYQYGGGIEIMMAIAHESGNLLEERRWAKKYAALEPNNPRVRKLLENTRSPQTDRGHMDLLGRW